MSLAPLYIYPADQSNILYKVPNINVKFIEEIEGRLMLKFAPYSTRTPPIQQNGIPSQRRMESLTPDDIFHYMYAVFHSPTYRSRYAEFLKMDFPRLPITSDLELFRQLCGLGKELVAVHLLEAPVLEKPITEFTGQGDNLVAKGYPKYQDGLVLINPTQGFEDVPGKIWEFYIGGYPVCHKWLKDRRGRQLSVEDIAHYQKIVVALGETIRLMGEIDRVIDQHGGWPIK